MVTKLNNTRKMLRSLMSGSKEGVRSVNTGLCEGLHMSLQVPYAFCKWKKKTSNAWENDWMILIVFNMLNMQSVPSLKFSVFDVTNLQRLNKHLLMLGVLTYARHSQHEKRLHIKGLRLCLGPAFGGSVLFSTSVECFIPCETPARRQIWTEWLCRSSHCSEDTDLQLYTSANLQVQRQVIFTAAGRDTSVKCCI